MVVGVTAMVVSLGIWNPAQADANRYIVEGRQVLAGQNPYLIPPNAPEALALVPDEVASEVNHPAMTAIYPPIALIFHAAVAAIAPEPRIFTFASLLCACLLLALLLMLMRRFEVPAAYVVAVAWHPVLLLYIIGGAHHDVLMGLLLTAALWYASSHRTIPALVYATFAALAKPFAVVCLPLLLYGERRLLWLLPLALGLVLYVPWLDAQGGIVRSLVQFGDTPYNAVLEPIVRLAIRPFTLGETEQWAVNVLLGIVLIVGLLLVWRRGHSDFLPRRVLHGFAVLALCLPVLHPWYLFGVITFLPFARGWGLLLWSALSPLALLHGLGIQDGVWHDVWWVTMLSHAPAVPLVLWEIFSQGNTGKSQTHAEYPPVSACPHSKP
jgi:hypothetical protein